MIACGIARSSGRGGGGISGTIPGGVLMSGSSSSSSDPSISGTSGGRGGFLMMMIGSPGARPGGLGIGSGIASSIPSARWQRRGAQLLLTCVRMLEQRLERVLVAAEHAAEPGHDLLLLEPVTPRRILRAADVLDHGEVAQAQHLASRTLSSIFHRA
jgi:hypothetical protein